jgi:hypothetical protein
MMHTMTYSSKLTPSTPSTTPLPQDAIVTASISASTEITEELLSYFVNIGNNECFAVLLYICIYTPTSYDILAYKPTRVMSLAYLYFSASEPCTVTSHYV